MAAAQLGGDVWLEVRASPVEEVAAVLPSGGKKGPPPKGKRKGPLASDTFLVAECHFRSKLPLPMPRWMDKIQLHISGSTFSLL